MMTLEESIKREQMLADSNYEMAESCHTDEGVYLKEEGAYRDRAEYHEQLAEWLKELKEYRKNYTCFNCYNSSASFSDYPCCECRRCFKALDGIKDHYEEVNADEDSD